ncbi:M20/M25/M40 family metallo-hydrolase [Streptomyces antnestii]|uniref:M20/M25/M40 family metallo-hydrolase n=1 Tax=Streptomyces antnestii TaxID=2494256 RepID=A0A3S2VX00_9ACTN|nr:M20/M25/M40 family metallo-hydrolase [Streptomyces sp. San01]RVU23683.1 M20/M25/M40 family metallo-hydrolase [Streptomyces sp. San01]
MTAPLVGRADHELLLDLLHLPTAGPLETGADLPAPELWAAQRRYAEHAAALGFAVRHHAPSRPEDIEADDVPLAVREAVQAGPGFLACQPSLVLELGAAHTRDRTVMFNVHLDTVAGMEQVGFDGRRFTGRGAVDAKGPAVGLLAGIRAALAERPGLARDIRILVQAVAGEEGGALGTIGTRPLVERGWYGRLNVFCEPTGLRYLPRASAAMTACVRVEGDDAIDDRPEHGHNATVLLGYLAQHLGLVLPPLAAEGRVCVAGLTTGPLHNRVYGRGALLLNLSYTNAETARRLESATTDALHEGLAAFRARFGAVRELARTARDAAAITRLHWRKRGIPALTGTSPWAERLLGEAAGIGRWPDDEAAFTCDAIWLADREDAATVVYGPGSLEGNHAHAQGEYVDLADLESFAAGIARILLAFHDDCANDNCVEDSCVNDGRVNDSCVDDTESTCISSAGSKEPSR